MCSLPMKTEAGKWPQVIEKQNTEKKKRGMLLLSLSVSCEMKQQVKQAAVLQDNDHLWTEVTELLIIALHCFATFWEQ